MLQICFRRRPRDRSLERKNGYWVSLPDGERLVRGFWPLKRLARSALRAGAQCVPYAPEHWGKEGFLRRVGRQSPFLEGFFLKEGRMHRGFPWRKDPHGPNGNLP